MDTVLLPLITILAAAINLYLWVVIVSAVLGWLVAFNVVNTRSQFVYRVGDVLYRLTNPPLRQIRRVVPSIGGLDLSAVVLILGLQFLEMVLGRLALRIAMGGF